MIWRGPKMTYDVGCFCGEADSLGACFWCKTDLCFFQTVWKEKRNKVAISLSKKYGYLIIVFFNDELNFDFGRKGYVWKHDVLFMLDLQWVCICADPQSSVEWHGLCKNQHFNFKPAAKTCLLSKFINYWHRISETATANWPLWSILNGPEKFIGFR